MNLLAVQSVAQNEIPVSAPVFRGVQIYLGLGRAQISGPDR